MRSKVKSKYLNKKKDINKNISKYNKTIKGKKIYKDKLLWNHNKIESQKLNDKKKIEMEYKKKDKLLKNMQYIVGFIIIFLIFILIVILSIPRISLDNSNNNVRYNTEYNHTGYKAKSFFKDYTSLVKVEGKVDTTKIGKYIIHYSLKYGFVTISKTKEVYVIDDVQPEIYLLGDEEVIICPNNKYEEKGYQAIDEYDGDITDKVVSEEKDNEIIYRVKDNSGNENKISRSIKYEDNDKPNIELVGSKEITLYKGSIYKENGYKATDNCDGDITDKVKVNSNVDTSKVGIYEIKYKVMDSSGNEDEMIRKVKVIEIPSNNNSKEEGVIYLTFDDGPSALTLDILKILDEENVKATFFVTSSVNSFSNILKKEYDEGHSIALHTYSHNYSYVYSSINNYFDDLEKISNSVEKITGKKSKLIRFPGGSSNTVSKNYSVGIMSSLTKEVLNRGYIYFDWNVDSDDAGSAVNNDNLIYNNVVNSLSYYRANMVLMHDSGNHSATVRALRNIIHYGKNNGYIFKEIDINTPEVRHNVNN